MTKTYDAKCFELAEAFLRDEANEKNIHPDTIALRAHDLAQAIQQTIEDFIAEMKP